MEEHTTHQHGEEARALTARIDEQLAMLLGPLGIRAEASSEPEPRLLQTTTGETQARVSVSYLHLRCRNVQRLSLLAEVMTFLSFHLSSATCVAHGATGKQKEGYIVLASATPFPESVTRWITAREAILDCYSHTVAIDLDIE
ncbi:MAG: hypothetical protein ACRDIV_17630 [Ktedonobacteraceae bacterium]